MFKVEASGFNPSLEICRLDDWKGYGKISEKRKVGSIGVQYYHTRKRMKDELLYSPDVSVFEKCNSSSSVTEGGYADDILCGLNIEDTIDDIRNSPLLDSYENVEEDPLCTADATTMLVATPSIQCREEVKRSLFHDDHPDVCQWEADNALKSLSHLDFVQLNEGKVICILNTEDSEIPCNDDIFMEIHPFPSFRPQIATDSTDPLASCANEKVSQQGPGEEKDPTLSFTPSQMDGPELSSDLDSAHPQGVDTSTTYSEMSLRTEVGSLKMIDPESMANNPSLSHKNSDGDGDLPNFCDIEAMILQLDLEYAQGSCIISEVTRHQYNYSDRTIIRLDNIACSSLIRSMSSLSAFATFYSRHFHYYIKKTEISGMNFLLEINDKYVQWYLNHIIKKSQETRHQSLSWKRKGMIMVKVAVDLISVQEE